jgi:2',3'-cyclic-nucleotide 2'-phosphodiesterase (5'-nucleotidase family)
MILARRALLALPSLLAFPAARADAPITGADLVLIAMSDLHSAMERAPAALGAVDATLAANRGAEAVIVINGDVFERGNALALRSAGAADWAFLAALRHRAPVVLNLGNHETALVDDLAETVRRMEALDIRVVSNLVDRRNGRPFASIATEFALRGGRRLVLAGIATDEIMTYRAVVRPTLDIPNPAAWAADALPALVSGADAVVVLSHAGVAADRAILPLLPDGALLLGGHEHLRFAHAAGATRYLHVGSWNRFVSVVGFGFGFGFGNAAPALTLREIPIEPGVAEDAPHAALIREVVAAHGAPEDRAVVLRLAEALPLPVAARRASAAMAAATGSAAGLIGHTSFGTGLPAGEVTRLHWDAFLRFDGPLFRAEADAAALAAMTPRLNQDEAMPLAQRIGDFAYAERLPGAGPALLASNGWVQANAGRFLGTEALRFAPVPDLQLKAVVARHLAGG